jgi:hypothetical protein
MGVSAGPRGVYDFGRVDENPVDRQVRMARATTEALNALGFFLCSSATRMLGADELDRALQHAAKDHLPFLLQAIPWRADLEARPNLARRILAGLEGDRMFKDEWKGWLLILVGPTALAVLAFAAAVLWMAIRGS